MEKCKQKKLSLFKLQFAGLNAMVFEASASVELIYRRKQDEVYGASSRVGELRLYYDLQNFSVDFVFLFSTLR